MRLASDFLNGLKNSVFFNKPFDVECKDIVGEPVKTGNAIY
jgi:hypothetical protein